MNGDRALRYARYRYVNGPEGTTFAREKRQQQVLTAIARKIQNRSASDLLPLVRAARTFSSYTETNLSTTQIAWFYRNFRTVDPSEVRTVTLEPYLEIFHVRRLGDAGEALRPRQTEAGSLRKATRDIFSARQTGTPSSGVAGHSSVQQSSMTGALPPLATQLISVSNP